MTTAAPVKLTPKQRERLIEVLAYIETHRKEWNQGIWATHFKNNLKPMCGTFACLAGHLAITLDPRSKPLVPTPIDALRKPEKDRTVDERMLVSDYTNRAEYLAPRKTDPVVDSMWLIAKDSYVPATHVQHRASTLIGPARHVDLPGYGESDLFAGNNKLPHVRRHIAYVLGMSQTELRKATKQMARDRGWLKPE